MRMLIIQENGRHEENRHFRECFSLQKSLKKFGIGAEVWGLGHSNYDKEVDFDSYDVIINLENYDTGWVPNLLEASAPKKLIWNIDAHCTGFEKCMQTFTQGNYDLILQATKDFIQENSVWFPNCYDDSLFYETPCEEKEHTLGFCGSLLNRAQLLDFLEQEHSLKKDIWVLGDAMVKAVGSYWMHFNINLANDINYRSFETLGCGTALVTNRNYQYGMLGFEDEKNCIMYGDIDELKEKLSKYSKNKNKLKEIIEGGRVLAREHTYDVRAATLIEILSTL
jgi:glycosyltransferase involved in cell wall biosynthesis